MQWLLSRDALAHAVSGCTGRYIAYRLFDFNGIRPKTRTALRWRGVNVHVLPIRNPPHARAAVRRRIGSVRTRCPCLHRMSGHDTRQVRPTASTFGSNSKGRGSGRALQRYVRGADRLTRLSRLPRPKRSASECEAIGLNVQPCSFRSPSTCLCSLDIALDKGWARR